MPQSLAALGQQEAYCALFQNIPTIFKEQFEYAFPGFAGVIGVFPCCSFATVWRERLATGAN
jgi:hypothetical protein